MIDSFAKIIYSQNVLHPPHHLRTPILFSSTPLDVYLSFKHSCSKLSERSFDSKMKIQWGYRLVQIKSENEEEKEVLEKSKDGKLVFCSISLFDEEQKFDDYEEHVKELDQIMSLFIYIKDLSNVIKSYLYLPFVTNEKMEERLSMHLPVLTNIIFVGCMQRSSLWLLIGQLFDGTYFIFLHGAKRIIRFMLPPFWGLNQIIEFYRDHEAYWNQIHPDEFRINYWYYDFSK